VALTYDVYGRLKTKTTGQMKQTYVYDNASGNLLSRDYRPSGSPTGLTESFSYDNLNRLTGSQVTGAGLMSVTYSPDGNINTKTDAGSYTYDPSQQNAVTAITGNNGTISLSDQVIAYNGHNLATRIEEDNSAYAIYYNPLKQRIKTVCTPVGGPAITRYYSGSYEKTITGSTVTETHYVSSPTGLVAILVKQGSAVQTYYVETDHLGSVTGIINTDKTYASKSSYDAWGRRRNPADWSYNNIPAPVITDRGFTGHEHLDRFGLINMNGRMYDPVVGRFLGVDPVVQAPDYSQSFNGYSYCWNNPLKYTDPSGYLLDAESWQRSMYESSLRRRGISQSDIWLMEYFPYWETYFDTPYTTSYAAGSSYFSVYSTLYGNQPRNPDRHTSGYWVREWANRNGYIVPPNKENETAEISEISVILRFVPTSSFQFGEWINTVIDHSGKIVGGASLFNGGVKTIAKEYVRQVGINQKLAGTMNGKLPNAYNAAKGFGTKLGVAGGLVIAGDILYNSEIKASNALNAVMTGIAFTGWGAPIAGLWFIVDFGTGLITGTSISDRIDANIGSIDWTWKH